MHVSDVEIERALLALLVREGAKGMATFRLQASDFKDPHHGALYETILALARRGLPITIEAVRSELVDRPLPLGPDGILGLFELPGAPPGAGPEDLERLVRRVLCSSAERKLLEARRRLFEVEEDGDVEARAQGARSAARSRSFLGPMPPAHLSSIVVEVFRELEGGWDGTSETNGLSSGMDELDRLTTGLHPGLYVLSGSRSTTLRFLFHVAARVGLERSERGSHRDEGEEGDVSWLPPWSRLRPVLVFTSRLSKKTAALHLLSQMSHVEIARILRLPDEETWPLVVRAAGALAESSIFLDDTTSPVTLRRIEEACRGFENPPVLLAIEGLRKKEARERGWELSLLAREMNVPILVTHKRKKSEALVDPSGSDALFHVEPVEGDPTGSLFEVEVTRNHRGGTGRAIVRL